jgi:hypothetical protein
MVFIWIIIILGALAGMRVLGLSFFTFYVNEKTARPAIRRRRKGN